MHSYLKPVSLKIVAWTDYFCFSDYTGEMKIKSAGDQTLMHGYGFFQKEVKTKQNKKPQQQQKTMYVSIQSVEFPGDQSFFHVPTTSDIFSCAARKQT